MRKVFGLALDLDGCIIRGNSTIPGAVGALKKLRAFRVPHIYLTNGGGYTEAAKAADLNRILGEDIISVEQVVLSHSPLQKLLPELEHKRILASGSTSIAEVARSYGFKNVLSVAEIVNANPEVWHQRSLYHTDEIHPSYCARQYGPHQQFDAIFMMACGDCWGSELQLLLDTLAASRTNNDGHIPLYCTDNDLLDATQYPLPRIGQGAALICLRTMYQTYYGAKLNPILYGKPSLSTYKYAEEILNKQARKMGLTRVDDFWGIGDNPESDINGANSAEWNSGLVRTGIFSSNELENHPKYKATKVFDSVVDAIDHILRLHSSEPPIVLSLDRNLMLN